VNRLSLVGNLTRDPALRFLPDGTAVCDLRLAVDGMGEQSPLYIDVTTFGAQATACTDHLAKGRQVAFDGRLVYREWQAEDGTKRSRHSGVGRVEFLGAATKGNAPADPDEGIEAEPTAPAVAKRRVRTAKK
jgi:single-strand DNA-binding protein